EADVSEESQEQLEAPPPKRPVLAPGSEIPGVPPVEMRALLRSTTELLPETRQALNDIRRSLQRFDRLTPQVEQTLREYTELSRETRRVVIPEFLRSNQEVQVASRIFGRLS